jgi:hypothetical protein
MRYHRSLVTIAAAAAVIGALPAHAGGIKTLDGKKVKALTFADKVASPQDNDQDLVSLTDSDRTRCSPPRCAKFAFRFAPAKGVKSRNFSVKITWTYPVEDYDLYVVQNKAGTVGQCAAGAGTSETVVVNGAVPRRVYTVVVDHYRTLPDTVDVSVTFPAKDSVQDVTGDPGGQPTDCGL